MFNVWFKELHKVLKSTIVGDGQCKNSHIVCKLYIKIDCKFDSTILLKLKAFGWMSALKDVTFEPEGYKQ